MQVTSELIEELSNRVNTEKSKKEFTYIPPFDIKKSVQAFLDWLVDNGYEITLSKKKQG